MTKRVVVVGTGTGVGKTWVARALAGAFRLQCSVVALKPVETGIEGDGAGASGGLSDARLLADTSTEIVRSAPYRFAPPVSPHLAARDAGTSIDLQQILTYVQSYESISHAVDVSVIETAGGLFSPLGPGLTNFDLARALEPACWVLLAADSLGVLHDVTATVGLARSLGRVPDFVVLSAARPADASTGTNAAELVALGVVPSAITLAQGATEPLEAIVAAVLDRGGR